MNPNLEEFIQVSRAIGANAAYVQGGGGNTSFKISNHEMLIKASGYQLSHLSETRGHCTVDQVAICDYLNHPHETDDEFSAKIKTFTNSLEFRPSIETGFHAVLGPFVIHTHSIFANLLTCSVEGEKIAKELFSKSLWIPYETPGLRLTMAIKNALDGQNPEIVFLQNHGVIISGLDGKQALSLHENLNQVILTHFNLTSEFKKSDTLDELSYCRDHILFPDQVVYTMNDDKLLQTDAAVETLAAYKYIDTKIKELGLTPKYIGGEHAEILNNMESEKYRQKVAMKK